MDYTSKYCNLNLNGSFAGFRAIKNESIELIEALVKRDVENIKEEIADVAYVTVCAMHTYLRINVRIPKIAMPTVLKTEKRIIMWRKIFEEHGLVFSNRYLVGGSNYKKQYKVDNALRLAREEQQV